MKTSITDPWFVGDALQINGDNCNNHFEDSFVENQLEHTKLADSEEYLEKLYSRLRNLRKGTSKKDLVSSLSKVKEDCIARLITSGCRIETEKETELTLNRLIRHIAPHLQAVTASELVHLLNADVLQAVTETEQEEVIEQSLTNKNMSIKALSGKVFLLITGASRGIGRQIAVSFGSVIGEGSHILLLARNVDALEEVAKSIPGNITVDRISVDLNTASKDELHDIIKQSLKNKTPKEFDRLVVVHNVGTIGSLSDFTNDMTDINKWRSYYDLNVFIPAILNGILMKMFNETINTEKTVINISSLLGIQPSKSTGYYCSGKAAREMFFKVFALENPQVNVLNYSPGPVNTDMYHEVCNDAADKDTSTRFRDMLANQNVLTTEDTVNRLLKILKECKYKSGDHVDYYDEL